MSVCIYILYKYAMTFTFIYLRTYLETESYVAQIGLAPLYLQGESRVLGLRVPHLLRKDL